ncbi:PTS sugar transporter subunit IIA [uncultured Lactobacillus sp.]|uniref:PTS sugar transporter subunit IIA n=1 Tax=uncultured Lactobacillus sp. TaxID=153152 RepID=UPI00261C7D86|nr:PTS sugar transporter subunit IIA [uncultured Lactobacillus sp.]
MKYIDKDLVLAQLDVKNADEAISTLADILYKHKNVSQNYKQAVLDREKIFPTGLPSGKIGVAIPHTDVKYVNKPAIAFATLNEPIIFKNMADKSQDVKVQFIAMLAMKEPHSQVELLQKLMELFQHQDLLANLIQEENSKNLYEDLASYFDKEV